jgi:hypothetical protein
MEVLDLIQNADTAPQVLDLLRAYVDTLRESAALPDWWMRLPLEDTDSVRRHFIGLMAIINTASRHLDHGRCAIAKQALSVFAVGSWKFNALLRSPARIGGVRGAQPSSTGA